VCSKTSSVAAPAGPFAARLPRARTSRWACFIVVLLGFGLRLYDLTYHSLWLDESVSVYLASFPLSEIFRQGMTLQEPNPPLYHLLLSVWMRLFGTGEASVRFPSVFAGTIYLPLVYVLADRLFLRRVALTATLLAAVSPFLVWYSQETRMYAVVAALSVGALYCFVRALRTGDRRWWVAYVTITVASLYTHFYAVFLLPAELLYLVVYSWRDRSLASRGILAWGLSLLCFVPWLWSAWRLSGTIPSWRPPIGLVGMLVSCLEAFTVRRVPGAGAVLGVVLFSAGALVVLGLSMSRRPGRTGAPSLGEADDLLARLFVAMTLLVPVLSAYVLSFRLQIFAVYYLIIIVAPFLIALAAGVAVIASLRRWAGLLSLLVVMGSFSYGLLNNWTLGSRKEEWRAAARYVTQHAGPGDAVLCHAEYTWIPFSYYYEGELPLFRPFGAPVGDEDYVAERLEFLTGYDTVWLVQSHIEWVDPSRQVEQWLAATFPTVTEQYPPGVEVKGYASTYRFEELPPTAKPVDAVFDDVVRLVGYKVDDGEYSATDDTFHPPSGWIHVTLYWEALGDFSGDYLSAVTLTDDTGSPWGGSLPRENSGILFYPPSSWSIGEVVRDDHDVNLNPRTPTGRYDLRVTLMRPSGEGLSAVVGGDQVSALTLQQVNIIGP
jgi:mannosyltransferase